jgi:hypothetical protein
VRGEYEIRAQYGTINGAVYVDFIDFDFDGEDEMEHRFGESEATRHSLLPLDSRFRGNDDKAKTSLAFWNISRGGQFSLPALMPTGSPRRRTSRAYLSGRQSSV